MTIDNRTALQRGTSIITREGADLNGPRLITDDAATVCVRAFPFTAIPTVVASGDLSSSGAYALVGLEGGRLSAYVGETGNLARRLQEHALDASKAWVREAFVLCGFDRRLDKAAVVHLQRRLSDAIESSGAARLIKGVNPCAADLPAWRLASLDRMFADALPLLFDAGCRYVVPALTAPSGSQACDTQPTVTEAATPVVEAADAAVDEETEDEGPMEIGVTVVPIGVEEQSFAFSNLWARGYQYGDDRFIVAAGSEMRAEANPSANQHTRDRRDRLIKAGAAKQVDDTKYRLDVALAFPSRAIAAKCLAGAHVGSEKWRPLRAGRPCVIAR